MADGHTPLKFVPKRFRSKKAIDEATSEQLDDLMALCSEEPADFENCLPCYAYKVAQDREDAADPPEDVVPLKIGGKVERCDPLNGPISLHYAAATGDKVAAERLRMLGMTDGAFLQMLAERLRSFGGPELSLVELDRLDLLAKRMLTAEKHKGDPR